MPIKQEQKQNINPWQNNNNNNIAIQPSATSISPEYKTQQKWSDMTEEENNSNNNKLQPISNSG